MGAPAAKHRCKFMSFIGLIHMGNFPTFHKSSSVDIRASEFDAEEERTRINYVAFDFVSLRHFPGFCKSKKGKKKTALLRNCSLLREKQESSPIFREFACDSHPRILSNLKVDCCFSFFLYISCSVYKTPQHLPVEERERKLNSVIPHACFKKGRFFNWRSREER